MIIEKLIKIEKSKKEIERLKSGRFTQEEQKRINNINKNIDAEKLLSAFLLDARNVMEGR